MPLKTTPLPEWYVSYQEAAALIHANPEAYAVIDVQALPDDPDELNSALADQLAEAILSGKTVVFWDTNPNTSQDIQAYYRAKKRRRARKKPSWQTGQGTETRATWQDPQIVTHLQRGDKARAK